MDVAKLPNYLIPALLKRGERANLGGIHLYYQQNQEQPKLSWQAIVPAKPGLNKAKSNYLKRQLKAMIGEIIQETGAEIGGKPIGRGEYQLVRGSIRKLLEKINQNQISK